MMRKIVEEIKSATLRQERDYRVISQLFNDLNKKLPPNSDVKRILSDISTEELCFLCYNLGQLSQLSQCHIQASTINAILSEIKYSRSLNGKMLGNCLYGIGKMATSGCRFRELDVNNLKILMDKLDKLHPSAQAIANTIWGLGKLAEAGCEVSRLDVKSLQRMVYQLSESHPNAQNIANTIWGLGKLAEAGCEVSRLDVKSLQRMVVQLIKSHPNAQEIANAIWGLGKLAEAGCEVSRLDVERLHRMVYQLNESHPNAQNIANTIWGLGKLAEAGCEVSRLDVERLHRMVYQLNESHPNAQAIANTIWGLGRLAEAGCELSALDIERLQRMVYQLSESHPNAQAIANTIWGLGKLAEAGCEVSSLDIKRLQHMVYQLSEIHPNAQNIANAIWGLGKLAEAGCEVSCLDVERLQRMVYQLSERHPNAQEIANTIWGLGKLAEAGCEVSRLDVERLQRMVVQLSESHPNAQNIANTIWGLGKLAEAGCEVSRLDVERLQHMIYQLSESHPNAQNIANTIWGLGRLAEAGCELSALDVERLQRMVYQLIESHPNAQDIANTIWGLGKLAEAGCELSALDVERLQRMVYQLSESHPNVQNIANTIWGLGKLAEAGCELSALDIKRLQRMVVQLIESHPNAQAIANTIWGLGRLAEARCEVSSLDIESLQRMVYQLIKSHPNAQEIANTIWGLGKLAEAGCEVSSLDVESLQHMVVQLSESHPNAQNIANTIWGLGKITQQLHLVWPHQQNDLWVSLMEKVDISDLNMLDISQIMYGLSLLIFKNPDCIHALFDKALDANYIHPGKIVILLEQYLLFSAHNELDVNILEQLIDKVRLPLSAYSAKAQPRIQAVISQLPENLARTLRQNLSVEIRPAPMMNDDDFEIELTDFEVAKPRITPNKPRTRVQNCNKHVEKALSNDIYRVIYNNDLSALERLLGLKHFSPKQISIPTCVGQHFGQSGKRHHVQDDSLRNESKTNANEMVRVFLERTSAEALKVLIQKSEHTYFIQLLRACHKHNQYQFAIEHQIHPIMIYLPSREIEPMVKELIGLGYYRDHRATISLIDALCIRKIMNPEEEPLLTRLQHRLKERALEFHSQHHLKVANTLRYLNFEQLGVDEEDVVSYAPQSVSAQPNRFFAPKMSIVQGDALKQASGAPNMQAYYSSDNINQLLKESLKSKPNIQILAALDFHQAPAEETLRTQLLNYIGEYEMPEPHHFIIPICIHQHWVGVRVEDKGHQIEISYYDSLARKPHQERVMGAAEQVIREIYAGNQKEIITRVYNGYKQEDGYSCGAYLIENIQVDALHRNRREVVNAEFLRRQHLIMLQPIEDNEMEIQPNKRQRRNH